MKKELFAKLKQGKTVYGTCISSVAPLWGKAAQNAGLDFVFWTPNIFLWKGWKLHHCVNCITH